METVRTYVSAHIKHIILISILAYILAGITLHQFDPTHPTLVTRDCMQASLRCMETVKLLTITVIGLFVIHHMLFVLPGFSNRFFAFQFPRTRRYYISRLRVDPKSLVFLRMHSPRENPY